MILKCRIPLAAFPLDIDVSFDARVTSIFGPSGAGKTSLLDGIAGLKQIASGEIVIDGRILFSSSRKINLSPQERSIGYVPQETALFPHLTVRKNILFGAKKKENSDPKTGFNLEHVTELLGIDRLLDRPVTALSGGEARRVALARAILSSPRLLLLDEPLASLDIELKERIIPYLRRVRDEFAIPMIYVTHDPAEVLSLADWVIMIEKGKLVAQGVAREVLTSSQALSRLDNDWVENVFNVSLIDSDAKGGRSRVRLESGQELFIPYASATSRSFQIGIRGDDILIAMQRPEGISAGNVFLGTVRGVETVGGQAILKVEAGEIFCVRLTQAAVERLNVKEGSKVFLIIKTRSCLALFSS